MILFCRLIYCWAPKYICVLRVTAMCISAFMKLPSQDCYIHLYLKIYVKTALPSSLPKRHFNVLTSQLQDVFNFSRQSGFNTSVSRVSTSRLLALLLLSFSTNPFVPCEILLYRTYSGSFWRVSESRYSLISIQYWQLHRLILSCTLRYCISLLLIWYCTGFMFCFSLSGVWSFTAVQYKI